MQAVESDWEKYYNLEISRFRNSVGDFHSIIRDLKNVKPGLLDSPDGLTFVLGGFVAGNGTPKDFLDFCSSLRPNNTQDKYIYLDMNRQPFKSAKPDLGVQAQLQNFPFRENSIDLIVLHSTTDFMVDSAIGDFAKQASRALTKDGIILMSSNPKIVEGHVKGLYHVPTYFKDKSELVNLMEPLKLVGYTRGERPFGIRYVFEAYSDNFAFARLDSSIRRVDLYSGVSAPPINL